MNHATAVTFRAGLLCQGSRRSWPQAVDVLRSFTRTSASQSKSLHTQSRLLQVSHSITKHNVTIPQAQRRIPSSFKTEFQRTFHASQRLARLKPYPDVDEVGLSFSSKVPNNRELTRIFGRSRPDDETCLRLLKVLHARRLDGTLDIPLDIELQPLLDKTPALQTGGLKFLRSSYPLDEDAATLARFEREEQPRMVPHPSEDAERALNLGLVEPVENYAGPQSGKYYAEVSEDKEDVFGKSEVDAMRKEAAEKATAEEEAWNKRVAESMEKYEKLAKKVTYKESESTALMERQAQEIELADGRVIRPPNSFERWVITNRDKAEKDQLEFDSPEVRNLTTFGRLWPSAFFVALVLGATYYWALGWEPPRRIERQFPNTSLAISTCGAIFAINTAVLLLWRFPPALRYLNKIAITVPGYPRAFSMLGNVFSHVTFRHYFFNMAVLWLFGPSLHEEIGRANFLMLYLGAGMVGSLGSLAYYVGRGMLQVSSNGASGAIWGVQAAYFWLHKHSDFSFIFIPASLQDRIRCEGWALLSGLVVFDLLYGLRSGRVDVAAHLFGMMWGVGSAEVLREKSEKVRTRK